MAWWVIRKGRGETYENALLKGVRRERVGIDTMQPRNSHDRRKGPEQKDEKQRKLFLLWPIHLHQRRHWQAQDEDVRDDVEARGEVEEGRRVDAVALYAGGRDGPEFLEGTALTEGHDEADCEEGGVEDYCCFADDAGFGAGHF